MEFKAFEKIQRYEKGYATITEKIDGTNACIAFDLHRNLTVQSRKRIITPVALDGNGADNYGFAHYARTHEYDLWKFFGPGRHYGEWFGTGINRGYGMLERVFAPFNTGLFSRERVEAEAPEGVSFTPVMWEGLLTDLNVGVEYVMNELAEFGSFTKEGAGWAAEGAMIFSNQFGYLKVPFEGAHKWELPVRVGVTA